MDSHSGDTEYEKILKVLADYYDAECCTIVIKDGKKYYDLFEYHKPSGEAVAEGLRQSLSQDIFEKCEVLLDEEYFIRPYHVEEKLRKYPELEVALEKRFVHNAMGLHYENIRKLLVFSWSSIHIIIYRTIPCLAN